MIPFYEKSDQDIRVFNSTKFHFPLHLHSQLELMYVLEEEVKVEIHNKEKILQQGDFIIIFPNILHGYNSEFSPSSSRNSCLTAIGGLRLTGEYLNKLTNYHAQDPVILREDLHDDVNFAMKALLKEMNHGKDLSVCKALIQLILARTLPQLELVKNKDSDFSGLIYQLVNFISQNFQKDLSLDILADELGVSKYYLSRIFSNNLKTNFNDYINSIRLDYATMLISTTDNPITQICLNSGFSSQRTFNRVFQETLQMTPREYRYKNRA